MTSSPRSSARRTSAADEREVGRPRAGGIDDEVAGSLARDARADEPGAFLLIGCGISDLSNAEGADLEGDLLDPQAGQRSKAERATDSIRTRFGTKAIVKGRALR